MTNPQLTVQRPDKVFFTYFETVLLTNLFYAVKITHIWKKDWSYVQQAAGIQ
ncbi:hypothetical protein SD074_26680 [Prolixibacter sp. SD074]|jgi:hypothetical protein|nr:hypothetical protein SD074_26680 [Prolixibacter sp. SD074]